MAKTKVFGEMNLGGIQWFLPQGESSGIRDGWGGFGNRELGVVEGGRSH